MPVTCMKHADSQAAIVTYEPEEPEGDDCPFCHVEFVVDELERVFARMWVLLKPTEGDGALIDVPLHARATVAWKLCEKLSSDWSISGDLAEESDYEKDEEQARKLAKLPHDFNAGDYIEQLREVCEDVLKRLKRSKRASKSTASSR